MHMKRTLILTIFLCCFSQQVFSQMTTEIWTDKQHYDFGETIELSLKVTNSGIEEVKLISACNTAWFQFDDFTPPFGPCVLYTHHFSFPPGSWRTWTFPIRPNEYGLPEFSGEHMLIGKFSHLSDTTYVQAPRYLGGRLSIGIVNGSDPAVVDTIRQDLNASVIRSSQGLSWWYEIWEIFGLTVNEAIDRYDGHPDIRYMEPDRILHDVTSVAIEDEPRPRTAEIFPPYPNPFRTSSKLSIRVSTTQKVRVEVIDLLGRRKSILFDGLVFPGDTKQVVLRADEYLSGRYIYRIRGETFSESGMIVVLR